MKQTPSRLEVIVMAVILILSLSALATLGPWAALVIAVALVVLVFAPIAGISTLWAEGKAGKHHPLLVIAGIAIFLAMPILPIAGALEQPGNETLRQVLEVAVMCLLCVGGIVGGIGMLMARAKRKAEAGNEPGENAGADACPLDAPNDTGSQ
jgi:hypothetical protein